MPRLAVNPNPVEAVGGHSDSGAGTKLRLLRPERAAKGTEPELGAEIEGVCLVDKGKPKRR